MIEAEKKVFIGMINNENFCQKAINLLTPNDFESLESQKLFEILFKFFNNYLLIPEHKLFVEFLRVNIEDDVLYQKLLIWYEKFKNESISENEFEASLDILVKKTLENKFYKGLEKIINSNDNIHEKIDKLLSFLPNLSQKHRMKFTEVVNISKEAITYLKKLNKENEEHKGILTGIDELDSHFGGWKNGELSVITAPTGEGKSIFLLNFAYNAYKQDKNVIFISLEMAYKEVLGRLLSLISSIPYSKIRNLELTEEERKKIYKSILENFYTTENETKKVKPKENNFIILDILGRCNIERIYAEILPFVRNKKVDIVFIDYINIIEGPKISERVYSEGYKARIMKVMAREFQIPIITAAQMNRTKDEKITSDLVKYAKAISENSDWVLGFSISDEDKLLGRIRLELVKHRHATRKEILVANRFNVMKIDNWKENLNEVPF